MKAQSSMEFLMTYGWALLLLALAISTFTLLGVSEPSNFVGERCIFSDNFVCDEFGVQEVGEDTIWTLILQNTAGDRLEILDVKLNFISGASGAPSYSYDGIEYASRIDDLAQHPVSVKQGEKFIVFVKLAEAEVSNPVVRSGLNIDYRVDKPGFFKKVATGDLVARVG